MSGPRDFGSHPLVYCVSSESGPGDVQSESIALDTASCLSASTMTLVFYAQAPPTEITSVNKGKKYKISQDHTGSVEYESVVPYICMAEVTSSEA